MNRAIVFIKKQISSQERLGFGIYACFGIFLLLFVGYVSLYDAPSDEEVGGMNVSEYTLDDNLQDAILETLELEEESELTHEEMEKLIELEIDSGTYGLIGDLSGLQYASNLEILDIGSHDVSNLFSLSNLTGLKHVDLSENRVHDISDLTGLENLDYLNLNNNYIDVEEYEDELDIIEKNNEGIDLSYDDQQEKPEYEVTLDVSPQEASDDVDLSGSDKYKLGEEAIVEIEILEEGYEFVGWESKGENEILSEEKSYGFVVEEDIVLMGVLDYDEPESEEEYYIDISIEGEGSVDLDPDKDFYTYEEKVHLSAEPTDTFIGWYGDVDDLEDTESASTSLLVYDNLNIEVHFEKEEEDSEISPLRVEEHEVVFEDYDGSEIKTEIVEDGESARPPREDPERTGYTFDGWDEDFEEVTEDLMVTAEYTVNKYDLSLSPIPATAGIVFGAGTYEYGEEVMIDAIPETSDSSFKHWMGDWLAYDEHGDFVYSVSYSPCGNYVVSGGSDNTVRVWDVETGEEELVYTGHHSNVNSVSFSPCGEYVVSGSMDNTVRVWDVETGEEELVYTRHRSNVNSVSFSPCGEYVVSGSMDNTVRVWDVETGKEELVYTGHRSNVDSVSFSPCGEYVVSGSMDNTVRVWDVETGEEELVYTRHRSNVNSVSFSPCGEYVVSGSMDNTVRVWDVETGGEELVYDGHDDRVNSVLFSADGEYVVSGSRDGTIRKWAVDTGKDIEVYGEYEGPGIFSVSFSPCENYLVSGNMVGSLAQIWDVDTGEEILVYNEHDGRGVFSVSFSPCGNYVVSGGYDNTVRVWSFVDESEYTFDMPAYDLGLSAHFSQEPDIDLVLEHEYLFYQSEERPFVINKVTYDEEGEEEVEDITSKATVTSTDTSVLSVDKENNLLLGEGVGTTLLEYSYEEFEGESEFEVEGSPSYDVQVGADENGRISSSLGEGYDEVIETGVYGITRGENIHSFAQPNHKYMLDSWYVDRPLYTDFSEYNHGAFPVGFEFPEFGNEGYHVERGGDYLSENKLVFEGEGGGPYGALFAEWNNFPEGSEEWEIYLQTGDIDSQVAVLMLESYGYDLDSMKFEGILLDLKSLVGDLRLNAAYTDEENDESFENRLYSNSDISGENLNIRISYDQSQGDNQLKLRYWSVGDSEPEEGYDYVIQVDDDNGVEFTSILNHLVFFGREAEFNQLSIGLGGEPAPTNLSEAYANEINYRDILTSKSEIEKTIMQDTHLMADFTDASEYDLELNVEPEGTGEVRIGNGEFGQNVIERLYFNEEVKVEAKPYAGYQFDRWSSVESIVDDFEELEYSVNSWDPFYIPGGEPEDPPEPPSDIPFEYTQIPDSDWLILEDVFEGNFLYAEDSEYGLTWDEFSEADYEMLYRFYGDDVIFLFDYNGVSPEVDIEDFSAYYLGVSGSDNMFVGSEEGEDRSRFLHDFADFEMVPPPEEGEEDPDANYLRLRKLDGEIFVNLWGGSVDDEPDEWMAQESDLDLEGDLGGVIFDGGYGMAAIDLASIAFGGNEATKDAVGGFESISSQERITIEGNKKLMAHFEEAEYELDISFGKGGYVDSVEEIEDPTYSYGDEVELEASSYNSFEFSHWSGDVDGIDDVESSEISLEIKSDISLKANFDMISTLSLNYLREGRETASPEIDLGGVRFDGSSRNQQIQGDLLGPNSNLRISNPMRNASWDMNLAVASSEWESQEGHSFKYNDSSGQNGLLTVHPQSSYLYSDNCLVDDINIGSSADFSQADSINLISAGVDAPRGSVENPCEWNFNGIDLTQTVPDVPSGEYELDLVLTIIGNPPEYPDVSSAEVVFEDGVVTFSGEVLNDGGGDIEEKGFCWSEKPNPNIHNAECQSVDKGLGLYELEVEDFGFEVDGFVRAYTKNLSGYSYGEEKSFEVVVYDITGSGTEEDPFMVFTKDGLEDIGEGKYSLDAHYELANDLDCDGVTMEPIAYDPDWDWEEAPDAEDGFAGSFDGNGYAIKNLTINADYGEKFAIGLFSLVTGEVRNVGVEDVEVEMDDLDFTLRGGLVSVNLGKISNSYVTGNISVAEGFAVAGGLVGANLGEIERSYTIAEVEGDAVGGLVGFNIGGTVKTSFSKGNVIQAGSGPDEMGGGLVGFNQHNHLDGSIENSYSTADVQGDYVAGLVGGQYGVGTIKNSYSANNLVGSEEAAGLILYDNGESIDSSYWDTDKSDVNTSDGGEGKTTDKMRQQSTFVGWDFNMIWTIDEGNDYPRLYWEK